MVPSPMAVGSLVLNPPGLPVLRLWLCRVLWLLGFVLVVAVTRYGSLTWGEIGTAPEVAEVGPGGYAPPRVGLVVQLLFLGMVTVMWAMRSGCTMFQPIRQVSLWAMLSEPK